MTRSALSRLLPPTLRGRIPSPFGGPRRHRAVVRASAVAFLSAAIVVAVPSAASARTYLIRQCNDGTGHPVEVTSGFVSIWDGRTATDGCAGGGKLSFTMAENTLAKFGTDGQRMGYSFTLPDTIPNARITRIYGQLTVPPMTGDATYSWGDVSVHVEGPQLMLDSFGPGSWSGLPDVGRGADIPNGSRFARLLVYCYGPCHFPTAPSMSLGATEITIDDPRLPEVPTFETFGLLDGGVQRGTKRLKFGVWDADSGIKRIELRTAAGAQLASTADGQGCTYTRPVPCPQERLQEEFSLDTTRLPDGKHTLELWVTDAAGSQRRTALAPITVQNAVAPVPTAVPAPTAVPTPIPTATPVLNPTLVPFAGSTATPTPTPGLSPTASPTPGAIAPGSAGDEDAGSGGSGSTPAGATTVVSFTVSSKTPRRGAAVTFSGSVTPVPSAAGRVMIEAKARKRWITAAVVRTRAAGAFTWSHKFSRRGTYTMRARLLTSVEAKTPPAVSPKRVFHVR